MNADYIVLYHRYIITYIYVLYNADIEDKVFLAMVNTAVIVVVSTIIIVIQSKLLDNNHYTDATCGFNFDNVVFQIYYSE